jgi:ABC-type transporter Mla subunit MlaD
MKDLKILTESIASVLKDFKAETADEINILRELVAGKDDAIGKVIEDMVALREDIGSQRGDLDLMLETRIAVLKDALQEQGEESVKAQQDNLALLTGLDERIDDVDKAYAEAITSIKETAGSTRKDLDEGLEEVRGEIEDLDDYHKGTIASAGIMYRFGAI